MSELKPCPFCGGESEPIRSFGIGIDHTFNIVECVRCWAKTAFCDTEAEAIEAWNTRTYPESEVMLMGDRVFINGHGHYVKERTCQLNEFEGVYGCGSCGQIAQVFTKPKFCPNCGAKVVEE